MPDSPASRASAAPTPPSTLLGPDGRARCAWVGNVDDLRAYHDDEWSHPVRGNEALFERIALESFQSGLSWLTILRRREHFRAAFAQFVPAAVAAFTEADVQRLLDDAGIIRNRR
ncbi:MAG TPA: DNA-3-methyladenine glycosylase I, partial [Microcella sp.]|nr:DNA-3-methyladenine glycosylase I [Microcella sp.]